MSDKIRVNYAALEDMAKNLEFTSASMVQSASLAKTISGQLQDGALVGDAGDTYCEALAIFVQKVTKLSDKYQEVANEIRQAIGDMQSADGQAGSKF